MTQKWHGRLTLDHDTRGVQKLHATPVPRIGGAGIFAGLAIAALIAWSTGSPHGESFLLLLACALPTFGAGLLEDLTKKVSVRHRLLASFLSPLLACLLVGAQLTRLDTPGLDLLMTVTPIAVMFTVFAVGGLTNAVNIVDGLNGLASGSVALMFAGLGGMAWLQQDMLVFQLCTAGIAAVAGFMVFNYPFGRLFLGDSGAYLLGFWLGECAVLLLVRNPDVSTWAPLLACFYPVWETVFSMYRRRFVRKTASGRPDMVHLHHLLLRRFIGQRLSHRHGAWLRHGLTSMLIWNLVLVCQICGVIFMGHSASLALLFGVAGMSYLWSYGAMVRGCLPGHHLPLQNASALKTPV